ncbi:MptD family putative ECF transporter S component [Quadrisphaera oryzae]|uniref:MptD family putative ECF transporter S component n=1 Tax=Quadrisphaera TaxID=317661 RepID=UPI001644D654|nr:MptD family putative ECF transporter S component [Quadrisphaera sp. RL12-1S]MBC3760751.1 MptD family putative ECF transporter S component [Quadrisphaera sp. RL12-1S]
MSTPATPPSTSPTPSAAATPSAAPDRARRRPSFSMSPRDLVDVGVFAALYIVVIFAINMLGYVNPLVMLMALLVSVVVSSVPFMLLVARTRHAGVLTLFAVLVAGLLLVLGHPPVSFALTVALAVVAEVVLWLGRYRSRAASVMACGVFSAWFAGPLLPLFYDRQGYFATPSMQAMSPDYRAAMDALFSVPVLLAFDVLAFVSGLLGGLLGLALLRKHFVKAGLAPAGPAPRP